MVEGAEHSNWIVQAFADGGPVMIVITFIGVGALYLIIERFYQLRRLTVSRQDFMNNIVEMVRRGDLRQAISFCDSKKTPLTNTVKAGLVQVLNKRPDEEVQVAMDATILRETPRLEGYSPFLAVLGNVAVLTGLLGTIIGMIMAFGALADADPAEKAEKLSQGISHALNATAYGLSVAIISIVAFGYFQLRIQRTENEVIESSMSLLNLVVSNRDKLKD